MRHAIRTCRIATLAAPADVSPTEEMAYDLEEPMRVLAAWAFFGGVFAVQNP